MEKSEKEKLIKQLKESLEVAENKANSNEDYKYPYAYGYLSQAVKNIIMDLEVLY